MDVIPLLWIEQSGICLEPILGGRILCFTASRQPDRYALHNTSQAEIVCVNTNMLVQTINWQCAPAG